MLLGWMMNVRLVCLSVQSSVTQKVSTLDEKGKPLFMAAPNVLVVISATQICGVNNKINNGICEICV